MAGVTTADSDLPSATRVAVALAIAPLIASFLYTAYIVGLNSNFFSWLGLVALLGAYPATILLALPIYLVGRARRRPSLALVCTMAGLVALGPWIILEILPSPLPNSTLAEYGVGNALLVQDGTRTPTGWLWQIADWSKTFAFGAVGGAVFWLIVFYGRGAPLSEAPPPARDDDRAA